MFYVYVLHSIKDNGFYIGFSTNLRARLRQHQDGENFATSHRGPWKLIYYEAYTEREDAEGREKFLKSGRRTAFPARATASLFETIPRPRQRKRLCLTRRSRLAFDHVSERFYVA